MEKKVLIIAAMEDVELNYLKEKLDKKIKIEYSGISFYSGQLEGKSIVLCTSNVGIINSAIALTIAIEKIKPDIIINEGLAGGYTNNVKKGDIVVCLDAINITSMEYTGNGDLINDYEITTFLHGEKNRLVNQKADEDIIKFMQKNFSEENLHFGRLASGDIWNKNPDRIKYINEKYGAICEDMEGISIYTVANFYKIPAICIKGISNNEVLGEKYDASVAEKLQRFIEKVIEKI